MSREELQCDNCKKRTDYIHIQIIVFHTELISGLELLKVFLVFLPLGATLIPKSDSPGIDPNQGFSRGLPKPPVPAVPPPVGTIVLIEVDGGNIYPSLRLGFIAVG